MFPGDFINLSLSESSFILLKSFGDNEKNATSEDDTKADIDNKISKIKNITILFTSNGNKVITDNKGTESKAF